MNEKSSGEAENRDENVNAPNQRDGENREHRRSGRNSSGARHRRSGRESERPTQASLNLAELRELADLIDQRGFTEFEFENENIRVRLRKDLAPQIIQQLVPQQAAAPPALQQPAASGTSSTENTTSSAVTSAKTNVSAAVAEDENWHKITSPIVGTLYRSPSPEAEPFVKVGSRVTSETVVCIVEAMKLMNEIPAEVSGEIAKIYVENGQPVEYGQPLFAVK